MKMDSFQIKSFFVFILLILNILTVHAAETYILDPSHTYILWHIKHFDFSTQAGKWYASGTLVLDKDKPENSNLKTSINLADVITGIPELDKHLKGKDFFDVEKFPTATFVSNKIVLTSKNTAKVYGMLNLHGISKFVTLNVTLTKAGIHPITQKMTAGFSAKTTIKRSDFGIKSYIPGLSDNVVIDIEAEASPSK